MMRVAIVDDEPLAREGLRLWLAREPDVQVVGEAGDGDAAVALVEREHPDVLFLDVQMPGPDGFATLARLADEYLPLVVFVTAYDEYAVRAFEVHALDYLLKPLDQGRLVESLRRARAELARGDAATSPGQVAELLSTLGTPLPHAAAAPAPLVRFVTRERSGFKLVPVESVQWIESAGNYIELHAGRSIHLVRMTLAAAESRLGQADFTRIHRTLLVRTAGVKSVLPTEHGDYRVVLEDGHELPMSRRYRDRLLGR